MTIPVINVAELLENLDSYVGQIVDLEGYATTLGSVIVYMKADGSRWKVKADERTILIDVSEDELGDMLSSFYISRYSDTVNYEVRWGIYKLPLRIRGVVERFNYLPIRAVLKNITYVCASDKHPAHLLKLGYGDGYIYEGLVEPTLSSETRKNKFRKHIKQKISIPLQSPEYDVDLNTYNGAIEQLIGKVVKLNGKLYMPRRSNWQDYSLKHTIAILVDSMISLGAKSNWIWLKKDVYHEIIDRITIRRVASTLIPIMDKTEIIGRLVYVPDGLDAPIVLEQPTNLMLEDLRLVTLEENIEIYLDDELTWRIS